MAGVLLANMPYLAAMLILPVCSVFFSASEKALLSLTQEELRVMAARPTRSSQRIALLLGGRA